MGWRRHGLLEPHSCENDVKLKVLVDAIECIESIQIKMLKHQSYVHRKLAQKGDVRIPHFCDVLKQSSIPSVPDKNKMRFTQLTGVFLGGRSDPNPAYG